jgi:hypothetical protein
MRPLVLAFSVWCMGFAAALLGLLTGGSGSASLLGKIVLDYKPFCESFVVETDRRFVTLEWEDGVRVFATGDAIAGPLHSRGLQIVDLVGHGEMTARVESWSPGFRHAQAALRERCNLGVDLAVTTALTQTAAPATVLNNPTITMPQADGSSKTVQ